MKKIVYGFIGAAFLLTVIGVGKSVSQDLQEQSVQTVRQAVADSVVQCCAIEGVYPPNIQYLEDNYGLKIDHDRYIVSYELFASNILPQIEIILK